MSTLYLQDMALIFDSMAIRKNIAYDRVNDIMRGYVDLGEMSTNNSKEFATEALVLMVVSYTITSILQNNYTFKPFIKHPMNDSLIYAILDPPHMIKLCRNCFSECNISHKGHHISFAFISKLFDIQEDIDFKFANKLSRAHLEYYNKKMNVRLATQTISNRVASAIDYLRLFY
ncbi:hypothetical protein ABEB36_014614 [Hypothenemus hampei]|uniref:THAP domain-containing protein 9 n=1 Tax=Hypothenemus hampei TaxID=57062 RepID=A0ABD1E2L1_HYPHA